MTTRTTLLLLIAAVPLAAAEPHWAFTPVRRPAPQSASGVDARTPIDAFLAGELTSRGLKFAAPAERSALLRRVTLDLIGIPPTREELHAFLDDASPNAYEKVVDRLLNDPRHGERQARRWMDVWRYSDWYGRRAVPDVMNSYPQIWRWRDWIVRSLNEDRGYDRMIREMLAADELCPDDDQNVVATGFLVRNWFKWNYHQWMRDNVEHVGKAFLGLTLNCCHCHDHKYDPIPQEDYFRFRAFFEPLELRHDRVPGEADPGPFKKYVYAESYGPIASGAIRIFDEKLDAPTFIYSGGDERNKIGDKTVKPAAPRFLGGEAIKIVPVNLPPTAWYPGLKPFIQREEIAKRETALAAAEAARLVAARKVAPIPVQTSWHRRAIEEFRDPARWALIAAEAEHWRAASDLASIRARIAADHVIHGGEPGDAKTLAEAAARAERRLALDAALAARAKQMAQSPVPPNRAQLLAAADAAVTKATAELDKPAAAYTPLSPQYPKVSSGRRLALANWIASPDNPLTARVAVNHLWGWHFGRPLVESTADFGRKGAKPSHPQLLDWLAAELMNNGWRFKPLIRQMVLSAAYQQSSRGRPVEADPDNRLLSRYPTRRMDAEVVRDSLLAIAGDLDPAMGGREIPHEQGQTSRRRSLYFAHHGESKMAWLELFDAANPCDCYRRSTSVMPQQALALANSELAIRMARLLARDLSKSHADNAAFISALFQRTISRSPTSAETTECLAFLEAMALKEAANSGATDADGKKPAADPRLRARELLAGVMLNHHEFVTVR